MDREKRKIIETVCKKHGFEMSPSSIIYDERYTPPGMNVIFYIPSNSQHSNKGIKNIKIKYDYNDKHIGYEASFNNFDNFHESKSVIDAIERLIKDIDKEIKKF